MYTRPTYTYISFKNTTRLLKRINNSNFYKQTSDTFKEPKTTITASKSKHYYFPIRKPVILFIIMHLFHKFKCNVKIAFWSKTQTRLHEPWTDNRTTDGL